MQPHAVSRVGCVAGISDSQQPLVRFESTRCDNCQCGRGYFGADDSSIEVQLPEGAGGVSALAIGQTVTLRVGAQTFSQAALLLFGLPIVLAFAGCGLAWMAAATVGLQAFGAAIGGLAGWCLARGLSHQMQTRVYDSLTIEAVDC